MQAFRVTASSSSLSHSAFPGHSAFSAGTRAENGPMLDLLLNRDVDHAVDIVLSEHRGPSRGSSAKPSTSGAWDSRSRTPVERSSGPAGPPLPRIAATTCSPR